MSTDRYAAAARTKPSQARGRHQEWPPDRSLRSLRFAVVALLLGYLVWNSLYYFPSIVDDAFISLRYARNLTNGLGLVYNAGEQVEGYSNFPWVMLEALLMRLDFPVITSLKLLGLAAGSQPRC